MNARSLTRLTVVACGTAYHAGVIGKYAIEKLARLPVEVDVASEFRYREPIMGPGDLFLAISQSGETQQVIENVARGKQSGFKTVAFTKVGSSTLAKQADVTFIIDGSDQSLTAGVPNPFFGKVILALEEMLGILYKK